MNHRILMNVIAVGILALLASVTPGCQPSAARYDNTVSPGVIKALLEVRPSPRAWNAYAPYWDSLTPPPDDAAPELLANWWITGNSDLKPNPSEKLRLRMADVLLKQRPLSYGALLLLPDTPAMRDRVKNIYDNEQMFLARLSKNGKALPGCEHIAGAVSDELDRIREWLASDPEQSRDLWGSARETQEPQADLADTPPTQAEGGSTIPASMLRSAQGRASLVRILIDRSQWPAIKLDYPYDEPQWPDQRLSVFRGVFDTTPQEQGIRSSASFIWVLLVHAESFRLDASSELRMLRDMGGTKGAIGTVMLADAQSAELILKGTDRQAKLSLLAAARIVRMPLPVDVVGDLLHRDDEPLADAADGYLKANRTPAAIKVLCTYYRDGLNLGANEDLMREVAGKPPYGSRDSIFEGQSIHALPGAQGQPDEIWAFDGGNFGTIIIRRNGGSATLTVCSGIEYGTPQPVDSRTRDMSPLELRELRALVEKCHADELPNFYYQPTGWLIEDGSPYMFHHITRRYGVKVCMDNPWTVPFGSYTSIVQFFNRLPLPPPLPKATTEPAESTSQPADAASQAESQTLNESPSPDESTKE